MTPRNRRITSLLLACALVTMQPGRIDAQEAGKTAQETTGTGASQDTAHTSQGQKAQASESQADFPEKSETVYGLLNAAGKAQSVYVVNRFSSTDHALTDHGAYAATEILSTEGTLTPKGEGDWDIQTGTEPLYYQGTLAETALPWTVDIAYQLDDRPITVDTLAGKSGKVTLSLTVTPRSEARFREYVEGMMLQASFTVPGEVAQRVETETGTVSTVGSDQRVDFVILPQSETVTHSFTADVQNFQLPPITIAAVALTTDLSSFDFSEIANDPDLKALQDGTQALDDATQRLAEGLGEADSGVQELSFGMGRLAAGLNTLSGQNDALQNGIAQYQEGLSQLASGGVPLREGATAAVSGAGALQGAMQDINGGWKAYTDGVTQYANGVKQGVSGLGTLESAADGILTGAQSTRDGLRRVAQNGEGLVTGSSDIQKGLSLIRSALQPDTADPSQDPSESDPSDADSSDATTPTPPQGALDGSTSLPTREELLAKKEALLAQGEQLASLQTAIHAVSDAIGTQIDTLEHSTSIDQEELLDAAGLSPEALTDPNVQKILSYVSEKQETETSRELEALHALYDSPSDTAPLAALKNGVDQMVSDWQETSAELEASIEQLLTLQETLGALSSSSSTHPLAQKLIEGVVQLDDQYATFQEGLASYVDAIAQLSLGFGGTEDGEESAEATNFYDGLNQWVQGLKQAVSGTAQLSTGADLLTDPVKTAALLNGQTQVGMGVFTLTQGLSRMSEGVAAYLDGVTRLDREGGELFRGINQYASGVAQVGDGLSTWQEGFDALGGGLAEAAEGATQLADGTAAFAQGTADIDQKIDEKIQSLIDEMSPENQLFHSFADKQNGTLDRVQFVLMTEAIKVPEDEAPTPVEEEAPSFWDRLMNLFH